MSKRGPVGVLAVLALVVVALLAWLVVGTSRRAPAAVETQGNSVAAAPEKTEAQPVALVESPRDVATPTRVEAEPLAVATEGPSPDELATAVWVSGTVRFPENTPTDERAFVVGAGRTFGSKKLHRVPVAPDGSFRVAFAPKTRKASLRLEARYVFLEAPRSIDLEKDREPVELAPALGGALRGAAVLDPAALRFAGDLVGASVSAAGWDPQGGNMRNARTTLDAGLTFELGGLDPTVAYSVSCTRPGFATVVDESISVSAGKVTPHDFALARGATLRGVVRDPAGAPVKGALVQTDARVHAVGPEPRREVHSDAEGRFACTDLRAGKVGILVSADGYVTCRSEPVEIAAGEEREVAPLTLARGLAIAGVARFADGDPAANVLVSAEAGPSLEFVGETWSQPEDPHTRTDAEGRFTITGLVERSYTIVARSSPREIGEPEPGAKRAPRVRFEDRRADVPAGTTDLVLTLGSGTTLSGRVVDDLGAPVAKFDISLNRENRSGWNSSDNRKVPSKHDDGTFEAHGLSEGTWSVQAKSKDGGESETVTVEANGQSVALRLVANRPATVRGSVLDPNGVPVTGATISVERIAGLSTIRQFGMGEDKLRRTDEHGSFEFAHPAGQLRLHALHPNWAGSQAENLDVPPAGRGGPVTLRLRVGGTIVGTAVDRDGKPAAGRQVDLWSDGDSRESAVDADGRFRFEHVAPGRVSLQLQPSQAEYAAASQPNGRIDFEDLAGPNSSTTVAVVDGVTVEARLGGAVEGGIRVSGVVRGATGSAIKLRFWGPFGEKDSQQYSAPLRPDGSYETTVRRAGRYTLSVSGGDRDTNSMTVEIPAGTSFVLDVELPGGSIRGQVVDAEGRPAAEINVLAVPADPRPEAVAAGGARFRNANATTDDEGRFVLTGLESGTYEVRAFGQGRFSGGRWQPASVQARQGGIALSDGESKSGIVLRFPRTSRLRGIVRDAAGSPVSGAWVMMRPSEAREDPWGGGATQSGGDGSFEFELAEGRCWFTAHKGPLAGQSGEVSLGAGASPDVSIRLGPGNTLVVECEDADGRSVLAGIAIHDARGFAVPNWSLGLGDEEDEARRAPGTFRSLPDGEYAVSAETKAAKSGTERIVLKGGVERRVRLKLVE